MKQQKKLKRKIANMALAYIEKYEGKNNKEQAFALAGLNQMVTTYKVLKELNNEIFKQSTVTTYTAEEIKEFYHLTELGMRDIGKILASLQFAGITNLMDVIKVVKLGYANFKITN